MLKSEDVQKLIDDNDVLLRRMADLGIEAANVATALTSRGAPAGETFLQELAEVGRLFAALRREAFAAASCLPLPLPPLDAVSSAADLKAMLDALCATVKAAERQAEVVAARELALSILGRVAGLAHVDHARFEPLQLCQERARTLRSTNAIESMISICRDRSANVKRWRDGQMALRWCAAGMVEAGKQFRRVNGHLHLRTLRAALERHVATENAVTNRHNDTVTAA